MAVRIRLTRLGRTHRPFYRIVASDARSPRDGKFLEILGTYNPLLAKDDEKRFILSDPSLKRINHWLSNGATPSETVAKLLKNIGIETSVSKALPAKIAAKKKAKEEADKKKELDAQKDAQAS